MRIAHIQEALNLDLLRSFFAVIEQGSLNKAAERMRVSQSTLTRQMQALEQEVGGALLERGPAGVAPTAAGHALAEGMRPLLVEFDRALGEARRRARGQTTELRIGYLMSAVGEYLNPGLATLRRVHPEVKARLLDMSPGEQIEALRRGELDLALIGTFGRLLAREFYLRRLATTPMVAVLADHHPLAGRKSLRLAELRDEAFVGAPDADLPGHNRWLTQLCRKAGFRARILQDADSLTHGLLLVVTDGAVSLMPEFVRSVKAPGVVMVPVADTHARWELMVAWQRGKVPPPLRTLLDSLGGAASKAAA